jgi:hypothetical protein
MTFKIHFTKNTLGRQGVSFLKRRLCEKVHISITLMPHALRNIRHKLIEERNSPGMELTVEICLRGVLCER